MTADERLRFIDLRQREMALSRKMIERPGDPEIRRAWFEAATEVDRLWTGLDPVEQRILNDLDGIVRDVYQGRFGRFLNLAGASEIDG